MPRLSSSDVPEGDPRRPTFLLAERLLRWLREEAPADHAVHLGALLSVYGTLALTNPCYAESCVVHMSRLIEQLAPLIGPGCRPLTGRDVHRAAEEVDALIARHTQPQRPTQAPGE